MEEGKGTFGEAYIHRFAVQMEAISGNTTTALPEEGICPGRSIAGNNVERLLRIEFQPDRVDKIEQSHIDPLDIARPVVSKNVVNVGERFGQIPALRPINLFKGLTRVGVVKRERSLG